MNFHNFSFSILKKEKLDCFKFPENLSPLIQEAPTDLIGWGVLLFMLLLQHECPSRHHVSL